MTIEASLSVWCRCWNHIGDSCPRAGPRAVMISSSLPWADCTVGAWYTGCADNCWRQPQWRVSWVPVLRPSNSMNNCSTPWGHMPLLNYSYQRANQRQKKKDKRNKATACQRTEWGLPWMLGVGMREAIGLGRWWWGPWRSTRTAQSSDKLSLQPVIFIHSYWKCATSLEMIFSWELISLGINTAILWIPKYFVFCFNKYHLI